MAFHSRVSPYEGHDVKRTAEAYHVDVMLFDQTFFPGNQSRDGNGTCSFRARVSRRTLSYSVPVSTFLPDGFLHRDPCFQGVGLQWCYFNTAHAACEQVSWQSITNRILQV